MIVRGRARSIGAGSRRRTWSPTPRGPDCRHWTRSTTTEAFARTSSGSVCGCGTRRSRWGLAIRSVIHECDASAAARFHGVIISQVIEPSMRLLREVIIRGLARADVRADASDGVVLDVIPGLMMYRSKVCGS